MPQAPLRVYADTSVFGGVFDEEFSAPSKRFFDEVRSGALHLVLSVTVQQELADGPPEVQALVEDLAGVAEVVDLPAEAFDLQAAYLQQGVVPGSCAMDALHVAAATVWDCAVIVSWNFRHIVNYRRIRLYNAVNALTGHNPVAIHTPLEVVSGEEEEL